MNAIRFNDVLTDNRLIIESQDLLKYLNQEVEIIVLPKFSDIQDKAEWGNILMKHFGVFDDETAKEFYDALEECSQIDYESWK